MRELAFLDRRVSRLEPCSGVDRRPSIKSAVLTAALEPRKGDDDKKFLKDNEVSTKTLMGW